MWINGFHDYSDLIFRKYWFVYIIIGIFFIGFFALFYKTEYSITVITFKFFTLLYFGYLIAWALSKLYDSIWLSVILLSHNLIIVGLIFFKRRLDKIAMIIIIISTIGFCLFMLLDRYSKNYGLIKFLLIML